MMYRNTLIVLLLILFGENYLAQQGNGLLDSLKNKYENFEYSEAIRLADNILSSQNNLPQQSIIEINMIKGISYFSLWNKSAAKECFEKILSINPDFVPDQSKISPKVISFFDEVKLNYPVEHKKVDTLTVNNQAENKSLFEENLLLKQNIQKKDATIKSIIFPGWGQQVQNYETKGWILTITGLVSLGSSIYFGVDSNKKEKNYLNETDPTIIQSKYDSYNKAYKLRNISLSLYAATWLFNLIDILFISK